MKKAAQAMQNGRVRVEDNPQMLLVEELRELKALVVLLLMKGGATQREIAQALQIGQATVSRCYGVEIVEPLQVRGVQ